LNVIFDIDGIIIECLNYGTENILAQAIPANTAVWSTSKAGVAFIISMSKKSN